MLLLEGYPDYSSMEFMDYLNRYCTGICLLKHLINKISLSYHVARHIYGNDVCRISIEVDLSDFELMTDEELAAVNCYFYNSQNCSGSRYVSFRFCDSSSFGEINERAILLFISYYEFTAQLLTGFIRNIVPQKCTIEIADLQKEPLFTYLVDYLMEEPCPSFGSRYRKVMKRDFATDVDFHNVLLEKSTELPEKAITDIELCKAGGGSCSDIRSFVLAHHIPFHAYLLRTIDNIFIDRQILSEVLRDIPESRYDNISRERMLRRIKQVEERERVEELRRLKAYANIPVKVGDLILLKSDSDDLYQKDVGIITSVQIGGNGGYIVEYHSFTKKLSEGRARHIVLNTDLEFFLEHDIWLEGKNSLLFEDKAQLVAFILKEGVRMNKKKKV